MNKIFSIFVLVFLITGSASAKTPSWSESEKHALKAFSNFKVNKIEKKGTSEKRLETREKKIKHSSGLETIIKEKVARLYQEADVYYLGDLKEEYKGDISVRYEENAGNWYFDTILYGKVDLIKKPGKLPVAPKISPTKVEADYKEHLNKDAWILTDYKLVKENPAVFSNYFRTQTTTFTLQTKYNKKITYRDTYYQEFKDCKVNALYSMSVNNANEWFKNPAYIGKLIPQEKCTTTQKKLEVTYDTPTNEEMAEILKKDLIEKKFDVKSVKPMMKANCKGASWMRCYYYLEAIYIAPHWNKRDKEEKTCSYEVKLEMQMGQKPDMSKAQQRDMGCRSKLIRGPKK
ncbi:MAG: hypothetical protein OEW99_01605 [Gammaproteobacteria bacterium]|nr:hypothetical protein [Gammaproteobacteria bacterium]MDH5659788.1 hypothetical protein [Gammaproteobacteria bacterium]